MSLRLVVFLDSTAAGGLEAICLRLHDPIVESHRTVAEGFCCAIFRLKVNVVQNNVAAWYAVAASKFHSFRSPGRPAYIPVDDLAYLHC